MSDKLLVRKIAPNLWQWREATGSGEWRTDTFYTGDINLLKESAEGRAIALILPGQDIVSERVSADISDRKQLLKILPYEMEEFIIDTVEDLHFVFDQVQNESVCAAYCEFDLLQNEIDQLEEIGAEVQRVSADYLQLPYTENGWTLLLENGLVFARFDTMVGFTVEQSMASAYLASLADQARPEKIVLYADNQDELFTLNGLLPATVQSAEEDTENHTPVEEGEAGFWDLVSPAEPLSGDFRTGRLARKLPFAKWWSDFKVPAIAAGVAFFIALGSTWVGMSKVEKDRRIIMAQTDDIFRQVVPRGNISDPERQLKGLLGSSGGSSGTSNAVYLISSVAPALQELSEVKVKNFRYSADSGQLQMNVEAKSFATFESLRGKIAEGGFDVEIKSANVFGDAHQAQIRISEAG